MGAHRRDACATRFLGMAGTEACPTNGNELKREGRGPSLYCLWDWGWGSGGVFCKGRGLDPWPPPPNHLPLSPFPGHRHHQHRHRQTLSGHFPDDPLGGGAEEVPAHKAVAVAAQDQKFNRAGSL